MNTLNNKKLNFRKLYQLFFYANFLLFIVLFSLAFIFPQSFSIFSHSPYVCDIQKSFVPALMEYWSLSIIPMCVIFILGMTFYIPILSFAISGLNGIHLAFEIYSYFDTYNYFYAGTMSFIALCISWIYLWYTSYVSCNSIRLFISDLPFFKNLTFSFTGKYIMWFALFSVMVLVMNVAQCIMYRI